MLTVLFWNLNGRPLHPLVVSLAQKEAVDIIVLAECEVPYSDLLSTLNAGNFRKYVMPFSPSPRLQILTSLPYKSLKPVHDSGSISVRRVVPPLGEDLLLVAVHLASKSFQDSTEQTFGIVRLARIIEEAEEKVQHNRTLIIGDLNLNPFEPGVVSADGLHGVMTRKIALGAGRVVDGVRRKFFYNPMWSRFGDNSDGPAGTYYYRGTTQMVYFWNIFDQVLLRPDLLPYFRDEDLSVIAKIADVSLLSRAGLPDKSVGSDHLPILIRLSLNR
jgi:endonuclease/exonuclease/phosphatase (EEP) superfamily protein YafD